MTAASARIVRPARGRPLAAVGRALAVALALGLALTGCSSSGSGTSTYAGSAPQKGADGAAPQGGNSELSAGSGADSAANAPRAAAGSAAGSAAGPAANPKTGNAAATAVKARLIRTGQVTIEVSGQLNVAVAQVKQVAKQFGGHVESETTGLGDSAEQKPAGTSSSGVAPSPTTTVQRGESLIVLRVPEPKLDDAIAAVTGVPGGTVLSQTTSSQDVTGDIADLTSRVASQRASLDRVRALMARATSLQDVVTLEAELSRRQSDLEALESRLATVSDQADLATLTVLLRTPAAQSTPSDPDTGFLSGLKSGWHALQVSTSAVLTVLGALLPLVVVGVILGWPALILFRRRARRRPATPPAAGWPYGQSPGRPGPGGPTPSGPTPGRPAPGGPSPSGPGSSGPGSSGPGSSGPQTPGPGSAGPQGPGPGGPRPSGPAPDDQSQPMAAGTPPKGA